MGCCSFLNLSIPCLHINHTPHVTSHSMACWLIIWQGRLVNWRLRHIMSIVSLTSAMCSFFRSSRHSYSAVPALWLILATSLPYIPTILHTSRVVCYIIMLAYTAGNRQTELHGGHTSAMCSFFRSSWHSCSAVSALWLCLATSTSSCCSLALSALAALHNTCTREAYGL